MDLAEFTCLALRGWVGWTWLELEVEDLDFEGFFEAGVTICECRFLTFPVDK